MNKITEKSLIDNLLSDEDFKVDWKSILFQAQAENWHVSTQICQQIFESFLRYPNGDVEKIICFFALYPLSTGTN